MEENTNNLEKYQEHYSEEGFWDKMKKFAVKAGQEVVYNALLLYYALKAETTSSKDKVKILGALGYLILPIDLIPDGIPVAGFSDDLAALVFIVGAVAQSITPQIKLQAAEKLKEWF